MTDLKFCILTSFTESIWSIWSIQSTEGISQPKDTIDCELLKWPKLLDKAKMAETFDQGMYSVF